MITERKEYTDAATQHYASEYTSICSTQTDPEPRIIRSTLATQTDKTPISSLSVQTDLEPWSIPKITANIESQTDTFTRPEPESEVESLEPCRSPSALEDEGDAMASSSSTVLSPTPDDELSPLHLRGVPPSYTQITSHPSPPDPLDVLKKWHNGVTLPIAAIPEGISEDTVEEWRALEDDLGVECSVIDKIIEASARTGPCLQSRRNRFYNICNTNVYRSSDPGGADAEGRGGSLSFLLNNAKYMLLWMSAWACVYLAMRAYNSDSAQHTSMGDPTYYDRVSWSSFNSMQAPGEEFSYDTTPVLWRAVRRAGFGAARIAGGGADINFGTWIMTAALVTHVYFISVQALFYSHSSLTCMISASCISTYPVMTRIHILTLYAYLVALFINFSVPIYSNHHLYYCFIAQR